MAPRSHNPSCEHHSSRPGGRFFFGSVLLGQGIVQPFTDVNQDGNPTAFGLRMTEAALRTLPAVPVTFILDLPPQASATAFTHIEVRYWPHGHNPPGLFDQEHFDFIPFIITRQEREQITAVGEDLDRVLKQPSADAVPPGFVQIPNVDEFFAEPRFGTRFFNPNSAIPLSPFTRAMFLGYYNGMLDFLEFAVAKAQLDAKVHITDPIPLPPTVAKPGYYPTQFEVFFDNSQQQYEIKFDNLVRR